MKTVIRTAFFSFVDCITGAGHVFRIVTVGILDKRRRIPPSRANHITGREIVDFYDVEGRFTKRISIGVESDLERKVIRWLARFPALADIDSQPVTVAGYIDGRYRVYTPDLWVKFDSVPAELDRLGFGLQTYIEVKPTVYSRDVDVHLKLCMLHLSTNLPAIVITESDLSLSCALNGGSNYVH